MKLRIVHLLSNPTDERESRSIEQLFVLAALFNIQYIPIEKPPYTGITPIPREANDRPVTLTPAHFGCWLAHKQAITEYLTDDIDALLICECDCVFTEPPDQIFERIKRAYQACLDLDLLAFTFGYKHSAKTLEQHGDIILLSQWIESHCYLVAPKSRETFLKMFAKPWDTYDYALTVYLLDQQHERIGAFADRPIAVQATGMSLIDGKIKDSEDHYSQLRY